MDEIVNKDDIKKELPNLSQDQYDLILLWVNNAYSVGYDTGSENTAWDYH